jgi:hypothetical protein
VYDRVARRDELLLEFLRARIVSGDRVVYVAEGADARTVSERRLSPTPVSSK